MKLLDGKVALITGASSGIGAVTAKLFAKQGAVVVLFARRMAVLEEKAQELRAYGTQCLPIAGDVTDPESCDRAVKQTIDTFGRLDILVNNAGDGDHHTATEDCSNEFWEKMIALNQSSVLYFVERPCPICVLREAAPLSISLPLPGSTEMPGSAILPQKLLLLP